MALLAEASQESWISVVLAALNVLQTLALAYLAADRQRTRAARKKGRGTREDDPPQATAR
jgi:hypothetical protein